MGKFLADVSRLGRKLAGDESGSPAVEFALVFPVFIAIVLATLQAASIFLVKAFFESAAEAAARVVLTNQTETLTVAQFQTEVCNQLTALFNCAQVTVELEPLPVGTTNLSSLLPQFNTNGTHRQHAADRRRRQRRRLGDRHAAGGHVSMAGLRRPARTSISPTWAMARC